MKKLATVRSAIPAGATVAACLIFCAASAFLLSWPHAALSYHGRDRAMISVMATVGLGLAAGLAARTAIAWLKTTSPFAALFFCGLCCIPTLWFSWLAYVWIHSGDDFAFYWTLLLHPGRLVAAMGELTHRPLWALLKGGLESPEFYCFAWAMEGAAAAAIAVGVAFLFLRNNSLCPKCGGWLRDTGERARFLPPEDGAFPARSRGDILSWLGELPRLPRAPHVQETAWIEARGHSCPNCRDPVRLVTILLVPAHHDAAFAATTRAKRILAKCVPIDSETERRLFPPKGEPLLN